MALNEVGGDPGRFSLPVAHFHERCAERARRFPENLLITQTHDTKRSGDSRARIGALAGVAEEWSAEVTRWFELAAPLCTEVDGRSAPDATEQYLIFQTLVGVWPATVERVEEYITKALREGKRNTNWVDQNEEWEGAVLAFVRGVYEPGELHDAIDAFVAAHAPRGERAAVGQLLLKLTTPGVPDIYQGDELWRLSMVDPDNRRAVDFDERREALAALDSGAEVTRANVKMHLIRRALALRVPPPRPLRRRLQPPAGRPDPLRLHPRRPRDPGRRRRPRSRPRRNLPPPRVRHRRVARRPRRPHPHPHRRDPLLPDPLRRLAHRPPRASAVIATSPSGEGG